MCVSEALVVAATVALYHSLGRKRRMPSIKVRAADVRPSERPHKTAKGARSTWSAKNDTTAGALNLHIGGPYETCLAPSHHYGIVHGIVLEGYIVVRECDTGTMSVLNNHRRFGRSEC